MLRNYHEESSWWINAAMLGNNYEELSGWIDPPCGLQRLYSRQLSPVIKKLVGETPTMLIYVWFEGRGGGGVNYKYGVNITSNMFQRMSHGL